MSNYRNILNITILLAVSPVQAYRNEGKSYGQKLIFRDETKISVILENPEDYAGKKILVKGCFL